MSTIVKLRDLRGDVVAEEPLPHEGRSLPEILSCQGRIFLRVTFSQSYWEMEPVRLPDSWLETAGPVGTLPPSHQDAAQMSLP